MLEMVDTFEFRPLLITDSGDISSLERECNPNPWSEGLIAAELSNPLSKGFGAFAASELAGYILYRLASDECEILIIGVKEGFRRLRIGSSLVGNVREDALTRNAKRIYLEVREGNIAAISLYTAIGFRSELYSLRDHKAASLLA